MDNRQWVVIETGGHGYKLGTLVYMSEDDGSEYCRYKQVEKPESEMDQWILPHKLHQVCDRAPRYRDYADVEEGDRITDVFGGVWYVVSVCGHSRRNPDDVCGGPFQLARTAEDSYGRWDYSEGIAIVKIERPTTTTKWSEV
jgi:hypothetical protein